MTRRYEITWPNGSFEVTVCDSDVAGLVNSMWGSQEAFEGFKKCGGQLIELTSDLEIPFEPIPIADVLSDKSAEESTS